MKRFKLFIWLTLPLILLLVVVALYPRFNSVSTPDSSPIAILRKRTYPVSTTPVQTKFIVPFSSHEEALALQKRLNQLALESQVGISIFPDAVHPESQLIITLIGPSSSLDNFFKKNSQNK